MVFSSNCWQFHCSHAEAPHSISIGWWVRPRSPQLNWSPKFSTGTQLILPDRSWYLYSFWKTIPVHHPSPEPLNGVYSGITACILLPYLRSVQVVCIVYISNNTFWGGWGPIERRGVKIGLGAVVLDIEYLLLQSWRIEQALSPLKQGRMRLSNKNILPNSVVFSHTTIWVHVQAHHIYGLQPLRQGNYLETDLAGFIRAMTLW